MLILKHSTIYHPNKICQPYTNIAAKALYCSHGGIRRLVLAALLFFFAIGIAAKGEHAQYINVQTDSVFITNEANDSTTFAPLQSDSLGDMSANTRAPYRLDKIKVGRGITFVGIPLVIAGIFGKSERHRVYYLHNDFSPKFKTSVDDYLQFAPAAFATGLKVFGLPGKSANVRYLASSGFSFFIMAAFVNSIKYTANQMRPDNSTRNSFPSGHTATAFVAATILHKEYGTTISPLYSIAGYGAATATGIMRMLNNRHWMSDVFCGAGIGIMSTELGYLVSDMLFKDKGLIRPDKEEMVDLRTRPSFFSIRVGGVLGQQKLTMPESFKQILGQHQLLMQFGTASTVGVEAAYFFTPHIHKNVDWSPLSSRFTTPRQTKVPPYIYADVIKGMRLAVTKGTATVLNGATYPVCGKTGTAENSGKDHSVFIGFAPMNEPKIAISVYIEHGGFGADVAAPIAGLIMEKYLKGKLSPKSQAMAKRIERINTITK